MRVCNCVVCDARARVCVVQTLEGHRGQVLSVKVSVGVTRHTVLLFDVWTHRWLTCSTHTQVSKCLRYVLSGSEDKTVRLWSIDTGDWISTYEVTTHTHAQHTHPLQR